MEDISKIFLTNVKSKMKRTGKTQSQLAKEIGVCYTTLNKTFNNNRVLEFSLAIKIANNLGMSIDKSLKLNHIDKRKTNTINDIADEMDDLITMLRNYSKK